MEDKKNIPGINLENLQNIVSRDINPILQKLLDNLKPILAGVAVIVLAAAVITGWRIFHTRSLASSQEALGSILVSTSGQEKIAALEKFLSEAPSALKSSVYFELAGASMAVRDFDKAAGYWKRLADEGGTDTAFLAKLGEARSLALAGKAAEAVKMLADLKQGAAEPYKAAVTRQLALAAEAAGDKAAALAAFEELAGRGDIGDKPYIDSKIAQLKAGK